jgi:anti-anti-sigma regulatory factor
MMHGSSHSPLVPLHVSIQQLDDDTALISVGGKAATSSRCPELDDALGRAENLGTPGFVIDLSDVAEADESVVSCVTAFQERCIRGGRWLVVVPPCAAMTEFLLRLS